MKYYHLVSFSGTLLGIQFVLQEVLGVILNVSMRRVFFFLQLSSFVIYGLIVSIFLLQRQAQTIVRSQTIGTKIVRLEQEQPMKKVS
ncbi:MAG: hypothetical protein ACK5MW_03630 [Enterococcus sp.]